MTSRCAAITLGGAPCKGLKRPGNEYCPAHDPSRQEARKRSASKAGKSKPGREMLDLRAQLEDLSNDILAATIEPKVGAVVNQILNTRVRLIETERRWRESDELAREVEELREMVSRDSEARRGTTLSWGA